MSNSLAKYLLILSFIITITSNAQNKPLNRDFDLSGTLLGRDTGLIILKYTDKNFNLLTDTARLKGGHFSFKGSVEEPTTAELIGNLKDKLVDVNDPNNVTVYLSPGELKVTLEQDHFANAIFSGSKTHDEYVQLNFKKKHIFDSINEHNKTTRALKKNRIGATQPNLDSINIHLKALEKSGYSLMDSVKKIDYHFISTNPKSYVSPEIMINYLFSKTLPADSALLFYNKFASNIKESRTGKMIFKQILEQKKSAKEALATDFKRVDWKGKNIKLADFKGKDFVLLDFWASWCIPCRKFNPELKTIYAEYHSRGFDIISISSDTNKNNWLKAIKDDETDIWNHVLSYENLPEKTRQENDTNLSRLYNVSAIPVLILIDKEGKIIGRFEGQGEDGDTSDLKKKLKEIFH